MDNFCTSHEIVEAPLLRAKDEQDIQRREQPSYTGNRRDDRGNKHAESDNAHKTRVLIGCIGSDANTHESFANGLSVSSQQKDLQAGNQ